MSNTVIDIKGVSKQYQLGLISHRTLYRDIQSRLSRLLKKEDPNTLIGTDLSRLRGGKFYALDDINMQINKGDVVGIIGSNGAGKSTLLKILSRVTSPTKGEVKRKGRIASLLEVGTGFHPELTGRENIFLNGAILGMRRREISAKFNDIVEFAGVEEFIDTPVKRYSSGMYVRLAFAVAAHLEPEILIVDEVLAVGDAEFQKRCLGKMENVSRDGRTILFVSHNMSAVGSLCSKCFFLKNGRVRDEGNTSDVIYNYLKEGTDYSGEREWSKENAPGDGVARLYKIRIVDENSELKTSINISDPVGIEMTYELLQPVNEPIPQVHVFNQRGECAFISYGHMYRDFTAVSNYRAEPGMYRSIVWIPADIFNNGVYNITPGFVELQHRKLHFYVENAISIDIGEEINKRPFIYKDVVAGVLRPKFNWTTNKIQ
jgi:lipopolysaccharide transport system ATP-binding protein